MSYQNTLTIYWMYFFSYVINFLNKGGLYFDPVLADKNSRKLKIRK